MRSGAWSVLSVMILGSTAAAQPTAPARHAPAVAEIQPDTGPPGCEVVIKGDNFDNTTRVRFNGAWLRVTARSSRQLRVRLPKPASSDHLIISQRGFDDVTIPQIFNVLRPASITGFSPKRSAPGVEVAITGTNFLPSDRVVLGDVELRASLIQPERIMVRLPANAPSGKLGIRRGESVSWSSELYEVTGPPVLSGFTPNRGAPGSVVRLSGDHFEPTDEVELDGERLAIKARSVIAIDAIVAGPRGGKFTIVGRNGRRAESTGTFTVNRFADLASFAPAHGRAGSRVTLRGVNFHPGMRVLLGNLVLREVERRDNYVVVEIPEGAASGPFRLDSYGKRVLSRTDFTVDD